MSISSLNQYQISWDDLMVAATVFRFTESADRFQLRASGVDRAVGLLFREFQVGEIEFFGVPDEKVLPAIGRISFEHNSAFRSGRTLV